MRLKFKEECTMAKVRDGIIVIGSFAAIYAIGFLFGRYLTGPAVCRILELEE